MRRAWLAIFATTVDGDVQRQKLRRALSRRLSDVWIAVLGIGVLHLVIAIHIEQDAEGISPPLPES